MANPHIEHQKGYRPDIDGLRAVAVVPVVLFHAGFASYHGIPLASGGYVGVDIFFVISGFLISSIIFNDIASNRYSIVSFYARRVRRIFPALFLVYLVCLAWGTFRGIPSEVLSIRNATVASIFFVSNVYFGSKDGYFDSEVQNNPLLHTWSLSIEEQFYVFLPLIMLSIRRLPHNKKIWVLSVLTLASLCASIYMSRSSPDSAYYSLLTRSWELGIGGLVAIANLRVRTRLIGELLGISGALAIVVAVMSFDKSTEFPGYAALLPTIGAASIIIAGSSNNTIITRCLSWNSVRWIGLISYSLYLWHWPVLVISRLEGFGGRKSALIAVVICFVISWMSWRLVEQPFRNSRNKMSETDTVKWGAVAATFVALLSWGALPLNSVLLPMNDSAKAFAAFGASSSEAAMRPGTCFLTSNSNSFSYYRQDLCLRVDPERKNILLIGDSHAAQYFQAIKTQNPNANVMQATASGCLPLLGTVGETRCVRLFDFVANEFLPSNPVDAVIISARWQHGTASRAFETAKYFSRFSKKVVIIGPNEEFSTPMPRLIVKAQLLKDPTIVSRDIENETRKIDEEFLALSGGLDEGVSYVSFFKLMCDPQCPTVSTAGDPLNFDENHLSLSATIDVVRTAGLALRF